MASKAVQKAVRKFEKENCKKALLVLNKKTDEDIIKKLDEVPSKQGYIKEVIRKDIGKYFGRGN